MLEILPSPDHVVAFRVAGTLTAEDYDRVIVEVGARLAHHDRIGVLVDLVEFDDVTAEAVWKDARFSLSLIGMLRRFPREAVVSDKRWVHVLARIADPLVPHVAVRAFPAAERDAALAWVADVPPSPRGANGA